MKNRSTIKPLGKILSIIGTDTEIGKTIVTAALARAFASRGLKVAAFKPFASDPARRTSGEGFSTDADLLARACGMNDADEACGQLLHTPLSPLAAARVEKTSVRPAPVLGRIRALAAAYDITLVEGCGGWEVPLTDLKTTADFFTELGAPAVIVSRAGLGAINHSLLTLQSVRARGPAVLGIVLNRTIGGQPTLAEKTNPKILGEFAKVTVWGPIPYRKALFNKTGDTVAIRELPNLRHIADDLIRKLRLASL